jgi:translocator protein
MKKALIILACILTCIALGSAPSFFTFDAIRNWYPTLNKPSWNPPSWLFGPVWTSLFTLMGISLYWILHLPQSTEKSKAIRYFVIQFGLNMLWSILFFTMHKPQFALIEIFILLSFIILTVKSFYRLHKMAAYLLIPYLLWVSFATILNAAMVWLNKSILF